MVRQPGGAAGPRVAPVLDVRTEVTWMPDGSYRFVGGEPLTMVRMAASAFAGPPLGIGPLRVSDSTAEHLYLRGLAHPTPLTYGGPYSLDESSPLDSLAIVVPVRDDEPHLLALVESLRPLLDRGARLVVVDDGSEVPVRESVLRERSGDAAAGADGAGADDDTGDGRVLVDVVRRDEPGGPASARNAGIGMAEAAGATFVALLDADTVVDGAAWLALLLLHFRRPRVVAVAPRVVAAAPGRWGVRGFETARSALDMGPHPARVAPRTSVSYVPSAALVLHLPRLRALLGEGEEVFREDMHVAEDVDLCWRLVAAGGDVRYEPVATVAHVHRLGLAPMLRRRAFYGAGAARLARDHEEEIVPAAFGAASLVAAAGLWWCRPWSLAVAAVAVAWSARTLGAPLGGDRRLVARVALRGVDAAFWQLASAALRPYSPAALALVAAALPTRTGRRAARIAGVAAVAEGVRHWWRQRPPRGLPIDPPLTHVVLHRLDDLAYGIGVWTSVVRARSARALVPDIRR